MTKKDKIKAVVKELAPAVIIGVTLSVPLTIMYYKYLANNHNAYVEWLDGTRANLAHNLDKIVEEVGQALQTK